MRSIFLALLIGIAPVPLLASFDGFQDFLTQYASAAPEPRELLAQSFIEWQQKRGGFPIVQPGGVIFVYFASKDVESVRIVGDFHTRNFYNVYWDERGVEMTRPFPDGSLFFKEYQFENDARLDYQFIVDGEKVTDPLNPQSVDSGIVGMVSVLAMPGYHFASEVVPRADVPKGKVTVLEESWAKPKVSIYVPHGYEATRRYKVIYTADGSAWINFVKLPVILDNLIAEGKIEPVIAVMIDPTEDRTGWYTLNPEYLKYLEKVIQYVDSHYSTASRPEDRLDAGTSRGGLVSFYAAMERPHLFRNIAMLSPSLTAPPHYYEPYFSGKKRPHAEMKIWLSAGSYEGYIYEDTQMMESYLKRVGVKTQALYTHEAHSFGTWRNVAGKMLQFFFPAKR